MLPSWPGAATTDLNAIQSIQLMNLKWTVRSRIWLSMRRKSRKDHHPRRSTFTPTHVLFWAQLWVEHCDCVGTLQLVTRMAFNGLALWPPSGKVDTVCRKSVWTISWRQIAFDHLRIQVYHYSELHNTHVVLVITNKKEVNYKMPNLDSPAAISQSNHRTMPDCYSNCLTQWLRCIKL